MKKLLPLLMFLFAVSALGQGIHQKAASLQKPKHYKIIYDKFKDETTIITPTTLMKTGKGRSASFGVQVALTFKGKEPLDEVFYWINFANRSYDGQTLNASSAIILADNKKIELLKGDRSSKVSSGSLVFGRLGGGVWVDEKLVFSLSAANAQIISESKVVEVQIGSIEVTFDENTSAYLKNLIFLAK